MRAMQHVVLAVVSLFFLFPVAAGAELPFGTPESVGMSSQRLEHAFRVVEDAVAQGSIPGAEIVIVRRGVIVAHEVFGDAMRTPEVRPMERGTLFDLASVSKLFTATALMMLVEQGHLRLDDPISMYLPHPGFAASDKQGIRVRHLLTHTSGLPSWLPTYQTGQGRDDFMNAIAAAPVASPPGQRYVYSDPGAILMGFIVEEVSGQGLDTFLQQNVFEPLGMNDTMYNPGPELKHRAAATEVDTTWRHRLIVGEVHDENASALGGVAGHAGLFSTALDLAAFGHMYANLGRFQNRTILSPTTVLLMIQNHTFGTGARRGLGFDLKSSALSSAGDLLSGGTFGHLGFTGTSLWIDPAHQLVTVLLTNGVHPSRNTNFVANVRPYFHNAVAAAITEL